MRYLNTSRPAATIRQHLWLELLTYKFTMRWSQISFEPIELN